LAGGGRREAIMSAPYLLLQKKAAPQISGELFKWPRYGMSISGFVLNPRHQVEEIVKIYQEAGVTLTRINLLATSWVNPANYMPFTRVGENLWDLYKWDQRYFDRLELVRDLMNEAGIVVIWTNYELYSWSKRKDFPGQDKTPWRNNINGVFWEKEDTTLYKLPDAWSIAWFEKVVPYLRLNPNVFEVGNEFPEKPLHFRVKNEIKRIQPDALVSVNRQEDTPGQYVNMKVGKEVDFCSYHGRLLKHPSDLERVYPKEPDWKTFNQFFEDVRPDPKKMIFSSDGARSSDDPVDTYNWENLRDFFREIKAKGCSIEHQSRAKMTEEPNHHMIEAEWFKSVIN
jgi:hypothetical protein